MHFFLFLFFFYAIIFSMNLRSLFARLYLAAVLKEGTISARGVINQNELSLIVFAGKELGPTQIPNFVFGRVR